MCDELYQWKMYPSICQHFTQLLNVWICGESVLQMLLFIFACLIVWPADSIVMDEFISSMQFLYFRCLIISYLAMLSIPNSNSFDLMMLVFLQVIFEKEICKILQSVFLRCLRATVCAVWGQQWSVVGKAGTNTRRQPETNKDKQTKAQTDKQG